MLEQKLFFTRNGEFTLWEKISLNKKENLKNIKFDIEKKYNENLGDEDQFMINNIYRLHKNLEPEDKLYIEKIINKNFCYENKLDFNALLYRFYNTSLDLDTISKKLEDLNEIIKTYNEESLNIYKYVYKEENIIDIRLQSNKNLYYKGSSYDQILNTEIRIYLGLGLIIITDFSDYTHKKSIKNQLLTDLSNIITGSKYGINECILTDMTLRLLLKRSKQNASKFKFSIEGLMNVGIDIVDSSSGNPLNYEHIKTFYEKHSLSLIRISMSNDNEKYITVDGNKGKLNSRAKNLESKDIDEFMTCLSEVMKYDYLNRDYINEVIEIAKSKFIMPTISKRIEVEGIYKSINNMINLELGQNFDRDIVKITTNSFFYCLLHNIVSRNKAEKILNIDTIVLRKINMLFCIDTNKINSLFSDIIYIVKNNKEDILEQLDRYIIYEGEKNVS